LADYTLKNAENYEDPMDYHQNEYLDYQDDLLFANIFVRAQDNANGTKKENIWKDVKYKDHTVLQSSNGFVEEYSNKETYCHSWVIIPGTSLLSEGLLTFIYLIWLGYLFVGIAIVSDIFME